MSAATAPVRLVTPAFVALAAATLAFFVAGGIVLPVAPQFAERALGADRTEVGIAIASFSIAALAMRPPPAPPPPAAPSSWRGPGAWGRRRRWRGTPDPPAPPGSRAARFRP